MRTVKNPEERKNEILDAAEQLFTTKGYAKTTINDILREVGIAKGTFYYYFQAKEEVMEAVVNRFISQGASAARTIAEDTKLTAHEKLLKILLAQKAEPASSKEQMIEELHQVANAEMHQKSITESVVQLAPILSAVVEQGIQEGVFQTPFPLETSELLLVSSSMLFDEGMFQWQPAEMVKKAEAFIHVMEVTLGAKQGSFDYMRQIFMGPGQGEGDQ